MMSDFVELRHYAAIVLKRWWVLVLVLIFTLAIGFGVTRQQEPVYKATASILVGQSLQTTNISTQDFRTSEELAQTYAALAQRQPVLEGTVEALGLDTRWQRLRGAVSAKLVPNTQLVEVTVESRFARRSGRHRRRSGQSAHFDEPHRAAKPGVRRNDHFC
jgi:capsular polysaccharide biosynthesis protein